MLGIEIINALKIEQDVFPSFKGIFAIDTIPRQLKPHTFIIVNKDKISSSGSHWFACCYFNHQLQIFDSLGVDQEFINKNFNVWKHHDFYFNRTPLQPETSDSCGQFVIYFCLCRVLNPDITFENLLSTIFTSELNKNEEIVQNYIQNKEFHEG